MSWTEVSMLSEIKKDIDGLKIDRKTLRNFGLLFCAVFGMIGGVMFWKGNPVWKLPVAASLGFLLSGTLFPMMLRQIYWLWMSLAAVLGWFMTRIVLVMAFSLIMTPMGLILKMTGKDLLDKNIQKESPSYWKKHVGVSDKERYRNQF